MQNEHGNSRNKRHNSKRFFIVDKMLPILHLHSYVVKSRCLPFQEKKEIRLWLTWSFERIEVAKIVQRSIVPLCNACLFHLGICVELYTLWWGGLSGCWDCVKVRVHVSESLERSNVYVRCVLDSRIIQIVANSDPSIQSVSIHHSSAEERKCRRKQPSCVWEGVLKGKALINPLSVLFSSRNIGTVRRV